MADTPDTPHKQATRGIEQYYLSEMRLHGVMHVLSYHLAILCSQTQAATGDIKL